MWFMKHRGKKRNKYPVEKHPMVDKNLASLDFGVSNSLSTKLLNSPILAFQYDGGDRHSEDFNSSFDGRDQTVREQHPDGTLPQHVSVIMSTHQRTTMPEEQSVCGVCTEKFANNGKSLMMQMPCGHTYHEDCLVPWLLRSTTCPQCRYNFEIEGNPKYYTRKKERLQRENLAMFSSEKYLAEDDSSESTYIPAVISGEVVCCRRLEV